ncbi:hypothetical protein [Roseovarius rhodophyticola]|uniref:Lipoprotein n=1 Tax=Roseovarius rhodophyticola TaxID=3080827 RepID=A0ABZ2TDA6_9RHOB
MMLMVSDPKRFGWRATIVLSLLVASMVLSACGRKNERILFDGNFYKSRAKHTSDDRQSFVVRVSRADQGLNGARAAGEHEGRRYCIENFGTSEIAWVNGPDADDAVLKRDGNRLILDGRCVLW